MKVANLGELFTLEKIDTNLYQGISWDLGFRALYGGQVLGQSIIAAYNTVQDDRYLHSLHSYFLLPGDANQPVNYDIEIVRDGGSFSTRRIKAMQADKILFYMTASFQKSEQGLTHQHCVAPKDIVLPKDLGNDLDYFDDKPNLLPKKMREAIHYHKAICMRTVQGLSSFAPKKQAPQRQIWLKSNQFIELQPLAFHQACLAYASDYHFLGTSLKAHGLSIQDPQLRIATIDHSMWFHREFSFNDWLLYDIESPISGNGRALVNGKLYNENGDLVVSCSQEGLVRHIS